MPNERLRAAMLERALSPDTLAVEIGVDRKTVERWIGGRTPYRRHRHRISTILHAEEHYLWPDALPRSQVAAVSESEIIAVYPHRSETPRDVWRRFFESAEQDIGILVYAGLFLAEDSGLQRLLAQKAKSGVRLRILLGDPECTYTDLRSREEGAPGAFAGKVRSAISHFQRNLEQFDAAELRLHDTVLYNSIYRADSDLLVTCHIYGVPGPQAPLWHIRRISGGELASMYLVSFEKVWEVSRPLQED